MTRIPFVDGEKQRIKKEWEQQKQQAKQDYQDGKITKKQYKSKVEWLTRKQTWSLKG
jgi:hypothetical protein